MYLISVVGGLRRLTSCLSRLRTWTKMILIIKVENLNILRCSWLNTGGLFPIPGGDASPQYPSYHHLCQRVLYRSLLLHWLDDHILGDRPRWYSGGEIS